MIIFVANIVYHAHGLRQMALVRQEFSEIRHEIKELKQVMQRGHTEIARSENCDFPIFTEAIDLTNVSRSRATEMVCAIKILKQTKHFIFNR